MNLLVRGRCSAPAIRARRRQLAAVIPTASKARPTRVMRVGGDRGTVAPSAAASRPCGAHSADEKEWDMDFWSVVGSIFWFTILFAWIMLLFRIFGDLFSDHELSGWGKALW